MNFVNLLYVGLQLDHPNIVRLEEVYESHNEIYLVQELCLGGELFDRLDEQPEYHYTEGECARLVKQMLSAVRYLHSKGIIHRDLKSLNIFVHETFIASDDVSVSSKRPDGSERMETHSTYVAKIGDWGSARATMSGSRTMTHGVGTACWYVSVVLSFFGTLFHVSGINHCFIGISKMNYIVFYS